MGISELRRASLAGNTAKGPASKKKEVPTTSGPSAKRPSSTYKFLLYIVVHDQVLYQCLRSSAGK